MHKFIKENITEFDKKTIIVYLTPAIICFHCYDYSNLSWQLGSCVFMLFNSLFVFGAVFY